MRADRLVAIVLLLQVRGSMTAQQLADELETSERTIRRDLEALCIAGVPLVPRRGRGGGWQLLGGSRLDLSGLTATEAEALFLASAPAAVAAVSPGLTSGLEAARRKILAALPPPLRDRVEAASASVHVDPTAWGAGGLSATPVGASASPGAATRGVDGEHLEALRCAIVSGFQVVVVYERPGGHASPRRLHPHGLVCKRHVWYLLASGPEGLRTFRLSRVRAVTVTDEPATRPEGFDVGSAWAAAEARFVAERRPAPVVVRLAVDAGATASPADLLARYWSVEPVGPDERGRPTVLVRFPCLAAAVAELAHHAESSEVVDPPSVREALAALGARLSARYLPTSSRASTSAKAASATGERSISSTTAPWAPSPSR